MYFLIVWSEIMKTQNYYTVPAIRDPGICDNSVPLRVVSTGVVSESIVPNKRARLDWYLLYITGGSLEIRLENATHYANPGTFFIISPGTTHFHLTQDNQQVEYLWIHFTGNNSRNLIEHFELDTNKPLFVGIHHYMYESWQRLFNAFILNDKYFLDISSAILTEILAQFSRYLRYPSHNNSLLKSISYIHKHFSTDIKINYLAKMENLSETHYRALFKKLTGVSPTDYITQRRIESALKLLENPNISIADVALKSGYNDQYYFIKVFKKNTGITPGKYRKNALLNE